jgi:AcrR family transcriptional regulator
VNSLAAGLSLTSIAVRTKNPLQADKILLVAARLFATHRFHEARMEDIAAAAEVGKGTLYRYFRDKDELYLALLARAADQLSQRLREAVEAEVGPRAKLEATVGAILGFFEEHPHLLDLITHAEAMRPPDREFPWQAARVATITLVLRLLDEARDEGCFTIRDPEITVHLLLGGMRSLLRFGTRPFPADLPRRLVDAFLFGAAVKGTKRNGAVR